MSSATETTRRSLPVPWKREKDLCPPERGKGPASAGRGFAHGTNESRRCYPYGRCKNPSTVHSDGPPSLSGKDKRLPFSPGPGCSCSSQPSREGQKTCVPLKGGKDPLAGRGLAHRTTGSRRCYPYGRCKNPSTSHRAGPPSLSGKDKRLPFSPGLGRSCSSQPSREGE